MKQFYEQFSYPIHNNTDYLIGIRHYKFMYPVLNDYNQLYYISIRRGKQLIIKFVRLLYIRNMLNKK